jgi:hypothetical protein
MSARNSWNQNARPCVGLLFGVAVLAGVLCLAFAAQASAAGVAGDRLPRYTRDQRFLIKMSLARRAVKRHIYQGHPDDLLPHVHREVKLAPLEGEPGKLRWSLDGHRGTVRVSIDPRSGAPRLRRLRWLGWSEGRRLRAELVHLDAFAGSRREKVQRTIDHLLRHHGLAGFYGGDMGDTTAETYPEDITVQRIVKREDGSTWIHFRAGDLGSGNTWLGGLVSVSPAGIARLRLATDGRWVRPRVWNPAFGGETGMTEDPPLPAGGGATESGQRGRSGRRATPDYDHVFRDINRRSGGNI